MMDRDHSGGPNGGHDLRQLFRVNGQLVIPLLTEIARTPTVGDSVLSVLGPKFLV
jgi:hypothetical protein